MESWNARLRDALVTYFDDVDHARAFFTRHQDKLLYGSDCSDKTGDLALCSGARQIAQIRQFSPSKAVERKVLYENAKKLFRL